MAPYKINVFRFVTLLFILTISPYATAQVAHEHQPVPNSLGNMLKSFGYRSIPIIKKRGLLYVKGMVAHQPVDIVLDTGSIGADILSDSVKPLNLHPFQSNEKTANMTGGIKRIKQVILSTLRVGDLQTTAIRATLLREPFKNDVPTLVLGNTFFEKYNAVLDVRRKMIYLSQHKMSRRDQNRLRFFFRKTALSKYSVNPIKLRTFYLAGTNQSGRTRLFFIRYRNRRDNAL